MGQAMETLQIKRGQITHLPPGWSIRSLVEEDLTRRAAPMDITGLDEQNRTVPATISTEQPVTVYDPINSRAIDEVLVARGGKFPSQLPLLDDHSRAGSQAVLGSARGIRLVDGKWKATLHFAQGAGTRADEVWQLVRQGHLTDVSIGYRYDRNPSSRAFIDIPPGKSQLIDGQTYTAGVRTLRVVLDWMGREVSTTPIGADDQAKIGRSLRERGTSAESLLNFQESTAQTSEAFNSASRSNQTEGKMDQTSTATETQTRSDASAPEAPATVATTQTIDTRSQQSPATQPATAQPQTAEQIRAERERVAFIYQQRGSLGEDMLNRAINEGWDTNTVNREFAAARTQQANSGRSAPIGSQAPAGHVVDRKIDLPTLQAAMLLRSNVSPDSSFLRTSESDFAFRASRESKAGWIADSMRSLDSKGNFGNDEAARAWDKAFSLRTMSMIDICSAALEVEGVNYNRYDREEILQRSFSTATLNAVFTTNFNAQLLEGFVGIADTTQGWVRVSQLPNFQLNERIQMHKFGRLRKVDRNQEIQDAAAQAVYESYKLGRYAEKFAVDEMDIMDDRFGALDMTPQDMGEAAGEIRPDLVYSILLSNPTMSQDSTALFHADHANYTSSGGGLGSEKLAAARVAVMSQKSNGRYINAMARNLIVPLSDDHTASVIVNSAELRNTTSSTEYGTKNWAQGKFNIVAEPRLDGGVIDPSSDATVAGQAGTFFLATDNGRGGIEVGYLAGTGGVPVVRRYTLDSGKLGMGWLVVMYVAAKAIGYQGLYCSKA